MAEQTKTEQTETRGLHLLVYDKTCTGKRLPVGLTHSWWLGAAWYKSQGRFDGICPAHDWASALSFLNTFCPERPIAEIQYWGHGKWGEARIAEDILDIRSLDQDHPHHGGLYQLAQRLEGPQSRIWFRTCETFGAEKGHAFATAFSTFMNCRVAGHTYIIGPWQSGLHCVRPGQAPYWPIAEGIKEGTAQAPLKAHWSRPGRQNTITCLHHHFPKEGGHSSGAK